MNREYEKAEKEYEKSLKRFPSKNRVCDIRVNLGLSKFYQIDFNIENNDLIIEKLNKILEVLYQDGCANEEDNFGKDENAEKLKEEIIKIIDELKKNQSSNKDDSQQDKNNKEEESNQENDVEEKLKQQEKEALENRKKDTDRNNTINTDYYNSKVW